MHPYLLVDVAGISITELATTWTTIMALRNRNVGPRSSVPGMRDVALGPAIYDGERYSKMSERLKRQHKKPGDVAVGSLKVRI